MKSTTLLAGLFLAGALGACAGERRATERELVEACKASSNLQVELCECVAKKAVDELSPKALALLRAGMKGDDERAAELMEGLSMEEATEAGMMMATASADCAEEAATIE